MTNPTKAVLAEIDKIAEHYSEEPYHKRQVGKTPQERKIYREVCDAIKKGLGG